MKFLPASHLAASIEVSSKQAAKSPDLPCLFPRATRVYIADMGTDSDAYLVRAARRSGLYPGPPAA